MRESAERKAERLLVSGRLVVDWLDTSTIRATCRGDSAQLYGCGYDPERAWWCGCPAFSSRCSQIIALQRVTLTPSPRRWAEVTA